MVKFKLAIPLPAALQYQNREVCDITEYRSIVPQFGLVVSWRGSVKDEYFTVMFIRGVLSISISEREMQLGTPETSINYAVTEKAAEISLDPIKTASEYPIESANAEAEDLTIAEVMEVLNWKCSENVKSYYDMLGN